MPESKVILVTGASSGFGALTARTLADAKHVVYAGMRGYRRKERTGHQGEHFRTTWIAAWSAARQIQVAHYSCHR